MLHEDLKLIESLIQDNIKSYKTQIQLDTQVLSTSIKLEMETIRGIVQNRIDSVLAALDKKLIEREKIVFSNTQKDVDEFKEHAKLEISILQNAMTEITKMIEVRLLKIEDYQKTIVQENLKTVDILKNYINEIIDLKIQKHLEDYQHKKNKK
jgi:hypothetical protein